MKEIPHKLQDLVTPDGKVDLTSLKQLLRQLDIPDPNILHTQVEVYKHFGEKSFQVDLRETQKLFAEEVIVNGTKNLELQTKPPTHNKVVSDHLEGYNVDFDGAKISPSTKKDEFEGGYDEYADEEPPQKVSPTQKQKSSPKIPPQQPVKPTVAAEENYDEDPFLDEYAD